MGESLESRALCGGWVKAGSSLVLHADWIEAGAAVVAEGLLHPLAYRVALRADAVACDGVGAEVGRGGGGLALVVMALGAELQCDGQSLVAVGAELVAAGGGVRPPVDVEQSLAQAAREEQAAVGETADEAEDSQANKYGQDAGDDGGGAVGVASREAGVQVETDGPVVEMVDPVAEDVGVDVKW